MLRAFTVFVSLGLLALPDLARAQLLDPQLRALQAQVVPYGRSTVEVLDQLDRYARSDARRARDIDLARYLRAIVSADLWVVARRNRDVALEEALANALGVRREDLPSALSRALRAMRFEPFLAEVDDALASFEPRRGARSGIRSEVLFTDSVARALSAREPLPALAALVDDPCASDTVTCPDELRPFDEQGRRAVHAVLSSRRAAARIRVRAERGDPLAVATLQYMEADDSALAATVLAPNVVGFADLGDFSRIEGRGTPANADVVVYVSPREIRYAFAPRVGFDASGVRQVGDQSPLLPAFETLSLPAAERAFPAAIPELVALFRGFGEARVAFAPSPELSTMDLWRVLRSADAAEVALSLVAVDVEGRVCQRPLEWREEGDARVQVYVRLGGYSVQTVGAPRDVPRIRTEDGWRHDVSSLRALVQTPEVVAVRAMHDMPVAPLIDALFAAERTLLVRR